MYSLYESESAESESEDLNEIDIETLTLEQYLALSRTAKRWLGRTSSDLLKTWDELRRVFIRRFCPPSVTFKQIGEIHNFRQEEGETLYQTWERFNDLLFKCPFHDLNDYQKENTFYKGLSFHTRQILDSRGLITRLTAAEALESIQEIVEHSHRWHKEESDKKTSNNSLSTITDKLKNLNHDMNNLRENIHKINLKSNMEFRHKEELVSNKIQIEELSMVKLIARCSAVLQNELPPKEKDPVSFVLPCIIGNTTVSNALADLGASISVMQFSMFKRLGLGNPRPVNMVIEMADRSMQSLKEIVKNVLVKIHKFIFPVDFVILDIVEDNKVPIILGRPMLATAHARIDIFGGKISLKVGKEQVIFKANEGSTPVTVSPVCAIKDFDVIDNIEGPDDLEEFLMDDDLNGDLGNFLQDNNLFLKYEAPGDNPHSPNKSPSRNWNPVEEFQDSDDNLGIGTDDFIAIDDL
ncbi:zinc knuckle CX2CX4HX4C containing protein [Tanacetum coccineum]